MILPKKDRIWVRMGPSDAEFHAESEFDTPGTIGAQKYKVMMDSLFPQIFSNFSNMKNGHEKGPLASYRAENLHARSSRWVPGLGNLPGPRKTPQPSKNQFFQNFSAEIFPIFSDKSYIFLLFFIISPTVAGGVPRSA